MLISVAVCTYNGEKFIREQLDSICNQTYSELEIIICDDVSTDDTRNILEEYSKDPRVRMDFNSTNLGAYANFEKAIRLCRGDWIAVSDQDDIWLPHKIETLYRNIGNEPLIYADSILVNEQGAPIGKNISDLRNLYSNPDPRGFIFSNAVWGHALFFQQSLKEKIFPLPEGVAHDVWIAFVAACVGGIKYVDEALVLYRQHEQTFTSTLPSKEFARAQGSPKLKDYKKTLQLLRAMKDFPFTKDQEFYSTFCQLYDQRAKGGFSLGLFNFLLKHRRILFQFSKKSTLSQLIEIRKQARGI